MDYQASSRRLTGEADRLESAGAAFFERTRQAFLDLDRQDSHRIKVVDASASIDEVWADIKRDIDVLLHERGMAGVEMSNNAMAGSEGDAR